MPGPLCLGFLTPPLEKALFAGLKSPSQHSRLLIPQWLRPISAAAIPEQPPCPTCPPSSSCSLIALLTL